MDTEKKDYVIITPLGHMIVRAQTPYDAFMEYVSKDVELGSLCLGREDLEARGYTHLKMTGVQSVFELITKD